MMTQRTLYHWFVNPEKEERWLEQMAQTGWLLVNVSSLGGYTFEQSRPQALSYKIDYRNLPNARDREDYLALFSDSGWQVITPKGVNYAYYFASANPVARRDIFSDEVSRAERNLRYANLSVYSLFIAFLPLLVLYLTGRLNPGSVGYQTPGLWQMTGAEFTFHFLFETPFVLLRGSLYVLPLIPLALGAFFTLRYYWLYRGAVMAQQN